MTSISSEKYTVMDGKVISYPLSDGVYRPPIDAFEFEESASFLSMDLDFFDGTESLSQGGFESGIGDAVNDTLMMIDRQHRENTI